MSYENAKKPAGGTGGNYIKKVLDFTNAHPEVQTGVNHIAVKHDDWCGVYNSKPCNCNPDVEIISHES
jgi:hypothetical protein